MEIRLENLGMRYADGKEILRNISFNIPNGCRVALIGQSGTGKSTLVSLVRRDRDPTSGRIMIDDHDLRDLRLSSVLQYMGIILQRPEILSGNVRENILLGIPRHQRVSDEEIWSIIDLVSPEMRDRFAPEGLNKRVGKQGMELSGGEQQRLCVMRALIKNPHFLIVDEATSSLDSETEVMVQQGIDTALARGIGALVIAHRFSTLRNCNQFVVLKKLSDCQEGENQVEAIASSMNELMDTSPTFRRLAKAQNFAA